MSPDDIVTLFAELSEGFSPILDQPSDDDIFELLQALYPILIEIPYDRLEGKHSLTGILDSTAEYVAEYGEAFPEPDRVGVYDGSLTELTGEKAAGERAKGEARHTAKIDDRTTYDTVCREARKFVLSKVEDTWVRELKHPKSFYTKVPVRAIIEHLQDGCRGLHVVDAIKLRREMEAYHESAPDVFQYINMLEDGMDKAERIAKSKNPQARKPIVDDDLLAIATAAHIGLQQFPRAIDEWEDLREDEKTWAKWKGMFKAAENRARTQAGVSGKNSFGGAGANAATDEKQPPKQSTGSGSGGGPPTSNSVTLGDIEACFDNLANAARADQAAVSELAKNLTVLTETNKTLVAANEKLSKRVVHLETTLARKGGGNSASGGDGGGDGGKKPRCKVCKGKGDAKQGSHSSWNCWEKPENASKRPADWTSAL